MNQTQLIAAIAAETELTQSCVEKVIKAIPGVAQSALQGAGDEVTIAGLVKLVATDVPGRDHRNPKTGETVHKPAHVAVKAKLLSAGKALI